MYVFTHSCLPTKGRVWLLIVLLCLPINTLYAAPSVDAFSFEQRDGKLHLLFDLSEVVEHNLFRLSNPDRVVIDFPDTSVAPDVKLEITPVKQLLGMRHAVRNEGDLRVVLDLKDKLEINSTIIFIADKPRLLVELPGMAVKILVQ